MCVIIDLNIVRGDDDNKGDMDCDRMGGSCDMSVMLVVRSSIINGMQSSF